MSRARAALLATVGIFLLAGALPHVPAGNARQGLHMVFVALLILLPLYPSIRNRGDPAEVGFPPPTFRSFLPGLAATLVLLPAFHLVVKAGLWTQPPGSTTVALEPLAVLAFVAVHLLEVVLPEELFFRGYLQEAWRAEGGPDFLGIRWHRGVWLQALAFGLVHVAAYGSPAAMDRVLPGIAFAYLRERSGAIWSPAVFHLACNLYVYAG